jgi:hypothetical protein
MSAGGEGGIRTPGTGFSQYNGLANRRLKPLGHLSAASFQVFKSLPHCPTEFDALLGGLQPQKRSRHQVASYASPAKSIGVQIGIRGTGKTARTRVGAGLDAEVDRCQRG